MADGSDHRSGGRRLSALPRLLARTSPRIRLIAGLAVVILGLLIATRPLSSLTLLSIYVGVSVIVSGLIDLASPHRRPRWWARLFGLLWVAGGVAVLVWIGRSIETLPIALAVLLIVGGLASLGDAVSHGRLSERVLALTWGGAQITFGILSLTWPDVTLILIALVFGVRTVVFGVTLVVDGVRGLLARSREEAAESDAAGAAGRNGGDPAPARGRAAAAGRFALAAVLVAVTAGGWWLNDWFVDGAPVVDAFYGPPASVPTEHGRLIRSDEFAGTAPKGGSVRRILYTTEDALGRPAVASALVIVPAEPSPGVHPVISWNHGTTGVAQGCAPSLREASATRWSIPGVEDALARGWVVVASDYSGQGAPGVFPYLIGEGEARSSLDAILAAREMTARAPGSWIELGTDVVVWGHSQGGHAALWTSQIADDYTPQLQIAGTVAMAPVAQPKALARELTKGGADAAGRAALSVLISWVLVPYADTYPDVNVNTYVAPAARSLVREMTQRCLSEPGVLVSMLTALGVSEDRPIYPADLTDGPLGVRLSQNAAIGPFPGSLLMVWGGDDEVVPPSLQRQFISEQCAAGQTVRSIEFPGFGHLPVIQPGSPLLPYLTRWTAARLDGIVDPGAPC